MTAGLVVSIMLVIYNSAASESFGSFHTFYT